MKRILIDHEKCTGCRICQMVCSRRFIHGGFNPKASAIRIMVVGIMEADVPVLCRQCKNAPCSKACPTNAFYRDPGTGALLIENEKCIGCGRCAEACPFGALFMHPERTTPIKCDLCDGAPLCVQHCPNSVLSLRIETALGEQERVRISTKLVERGGK